MRLTKFKLGDICTFKYGQMPRKEELVDNGYPVFSGYRIVGYSSRFHYKDPEIVIVARGVGGTGDIKMSPPHCFLTNLSIAALPKQDAEVDKVFLYYLLASTKLWGLRTGTAQAQITIERLQRHEVELPPIHVQRKVVSIVAPYDDLIANNTRRIEILEQMAQMLYREWFVSFCFPGHEKVEMVKSELGPIPEGWTVRNVEAAVKRVPSGKKFDQKTVATKGLVPVLDQGKSGIIGYHNEAPSVEANPDDPIIVFANHTCYQRLVMFSFSAIQNVLPFRSSDEFPRDIYWLHWATRDLVKFNDYKGHWPEFMSKRLIIPSPNICSEFGKKIKSFMHATYVFERKNDNLQKTRDLLLPKLVSGEISVEQMETEAAAQMV